METICTTDDPLDSLPAHQYLASGRLNCKVYPAFRTDKAIAIEDTVAFTKYIRLLGELTNTGIASYDDYVYALKSRHTYFHEMGCRLSDHGLETLYAEDFTVKEIQRIFEKATSPLQPHISRTEAIKFKSAMLMHFAEWDWEKKWTQQFHLGALRSNNYRMQARPGTESGFDSIGDFPQMAAMARFFNKLDRDGKLTRTIIYNLNPADNEIFATMIGNFNDGSLRAKMQWGSAWWFLNQKDGMETPEYPFEYGTDKPVRRHAYRFKKLSFLQPP